MAYSRQALQLRIYGTSSRSSTNLNTSKDSNYNWTKSTADNLISIVWKSIAYASSFLKPVASLTFRNKSESIKEHSTKQPEQDDRTAQTNTAVFNMSRSSNNNVTAGDKATNFLAEKIVAEKQSGLEETFYAWISGKGLQERKAFLEETKRRKSNVCKSSVEQRSRSLVKSLQCATSVPSHLVRLDEICKHLLANPEEKHIMLNEGLLRSLLWLRSQSADKSVLSQVRVAMSLLGFHDPPNANGIRILCIDGGGTRGIMAIEILRQLEAKTSQKIFQLFDYICGVSSGAILSLLLGGLRMSLDECETLYRQLSMEVFTQSPLWGTGRLMWSHAYYDTTMWVNMLKNVFEEKLLIDVVRDEQSPKIAAISAVMNLSSLRAFVFRNYDFPPLSQSQYLGSCSYKMWEAIRASGAAPGYFEEYNLGDYLHQDGGVMINNPAALAIHESRLLWPSEHIQCVMSLGSGRYLPASTTDFTSTSLKTKILKIIDSATDTEGVHITLHDLLSSNTYFRFNPYLTEFLTLDENRPEKLQQLKTDAQMYLRRNEYKLNHAVSVLTQPRSRPKQLYDWLQMKKLLLF